MSRRALSSLACSCRAGPQQANSLWEFPSGRSPPAYTHIRSREARVAGRINDEDVRVLRERADLATVVGDYTSLKRTGTRLKGLCPFHEERTPSFTVDPGRGVYHCFGCDDGGDVYAF